MSCSIARKPPDLIEQQRQPFGRSSTSGVVRLADASAPTPAVGAGVDVAAVESMCCKSRRSTEEPGANSFMTTAMRGR